MRPIFVSAGLIVVALMALVPSWTVWAGSQKLRIIFLDVGQGDAVLVQTPDGKNMLLDTGPPGSVVAEKLAKFWYRHDRKLDLLVFTHAHADHVGGFSLIDQYLDVDSVGWKHTEENPVTLNLQTKILKADVKAHDLRAKNDFTLGCCTQVDVVWPLENHDPWRETDENQNSVSMLISYGDFQALLTGDLGSEYEIEMLSKSDVAWDEVDILKLGHHGSDTSTSEELLEATTPVVGIVSAAEKNLYGHPDPEVMQRLQDFGIRSFETSKLGSIVVETDGRSYWNVKSEIGVEQMREAL